jgi:hypothetical protein
MEQHLFSIIILYPPSSSKHEEDMMFLHKAGIVKQLFNSKTNPKVMTNDKCRQPVQQPLLHCQRAHPTRLLQIF